MGTHSARAAAISSAQAADAASATEGHWRRGEGCVSWPCAGTAAVCLRASRKQAAGAGRPNELLTPPGV